MPRVFQPKYGPPQDRRQCRTYWADFSIRGQRHRVPLKTRDKKVALQSLADLVRREERRAAGIWVPSEDHTTGPISTLLEEFSASLVARSVSARHLKSRTKDLDEFVDMFAIRTAADLDPTQGDRWIAALRSRDLAPATINGRLRALKQFGRWLVAYGRLTKSPFGTVRLLNEHIGRKHKRRALSPEELGRLQHAARERPLAEARARRSDSRVSLKERARLGLIGRTRALVYAFCAGTGARRGETRQLRWRDLDRDDRIAIIAADHAKSRREQRLFIHSDMALALGEYRSLLRLAPDDFLFPRRMFPTIRTFHKDAAAAGIERVDHRGRVIDFHALRTTFISRLSVAGVHPRIAQALARHGSLELTMQTYTDVDQLDLRGAAEVLRERPRTRL